jgi:23S rRNA pseudouridine2604 synthase
MYFIPKLISRQLLRQKAVNPLRCVLAPDVSFSTESGRVKTVHQGYDADESDPCQLVRLSKRMSELGICSRREAAKILKETTWAKDVLHFEQVIYLKGEPVTGGTGVKVAPDEQFIEIRSVDSLESDANCTSFVPYNKLPWEKIRGDTIVLNKPIGYVSGQEEHQHVPAVRLLTPSNLHIDQDDAESKESVLNESTFKFTRKKWDGFDLNSSSVPKQIKNQLGVGKGNSSAENKLDNEPTLSGYATAGRLDIDSTGLIIFTRAGVMARRLIAPDSKIPKEVSSCMFYALLPKKIKLMMYKYLYILFY